MIRVLVADDEYRVCQLICRIVDWSSFDMEIVATAKNGIEVLEYIKTDPVDLIVTDINMPGLNGIEMIEKLKQNNPNIEIIIISGHRNFTYAQSAIKFAVSDYLLKPINRKEISIALEKMQKKILIKRDDALRDNFEEKAGKERREESEKSNARKSAVLDLLKNDSDTQNSELSSKADYLLGFSHDIFQSIVVKLDKNNITTTRSSVFAILDRAAKLISRYLSGIVEFEFVQDENRLLFLINYDHKDLSEVERSRKLIVQEISQVSDLFLPMRVSIGIGGQKNRIAEAKKSSQEAETALFQRIFEQGNMHFIYDPEEKRENALKHEYILDIQLKIKKAVFKNDQNTSDMAINDFFQEIESQNLTGEAVLDGLKSIYFSLLSELYELSPDNISIGDEFKLFSQDIEGISSVDKLKLYTKQKICHELKSNAERIELIENIPISKAKEYIKQNYTSQIFLEDVAAIAGFNPSYFSTLFKKRTNISFNEYLSSLRLEKAKELLVNSSESIFDICIKVGYNDRRHFSQLFKKYSGLTPNEYRKLYS